MKQRIASFRRRVDAHFGGRPGRGSRYPSALQGLAQELAIEAQAQGISVGSLGRRLGLGAGTLRRWLEAGPNKRQPLRAVEVVQWPAEVESAPLQVGSLVLITAAGHRIEGLSLTEVSRLLEVLG